MKALEGIRVIDFTHDQAGPACTQMLAWLGADVIKIERPGVGDRARGLYPGPTPNPESYFFLLLNNNKRSTVIDLKSEEGMAIARKMVEKADVVTENLGPGAMDRLGLTWENVHQLNPRAVYASVKGFGSYGPYADYKCFEMVAQAMSGVMSVTGYPDTPMVTGANVGDSGTGMHLAIAILGALMQRERTGKGQRVEVAMQEAALNLTRTKYAYTLTTGQPHPRTGNRSASGNFTDLYRCAGDKPTDCVYLFLASDNPEAFKALAKITGRPDLLTDARFNTPQARIHHYDEMGEAITAWTRQHDKRSVMQTLSAAGIACGMVLDTTEVLADPHLRERGTVFDIDHPTRGRMSMIGCPLRLSDSPVENRRAPMLGEHTGEVLQELFGYTAEDIARLRRDKVIR